MTDTNYVDEQELVGKTITSIKESDDMFDESYIIEFSDNTEYKISAWCSSGEGGIYIERIK